MQDLSGAASLGVNTSALVVLADGGPLVCAKAGCGGAAPIALTSLETVAKGPHSLYLDEQNVYWLGRGTPGAHFELRKCAVAGCGLTPVVIDEGQLGDEIRGEGNAILRYDSTGDITRVYADQSSSKDYLDEATIPASHRFALKDGKMAFSSLDSATSSNRGVWFGDFANTRPERLMNEGLLVAIQDGIVYASRPVDETHHTIYSCPFGGCGSVGTPLGGVGLAAETGEIVDMTADSGGLYWIERAGTVGRVMRCALPDCAGGPTALAESQDDPVAIVTDANFVYWVNAGTGAAGGAALRVAK